MTILQSIILGIVQGLTEFLPISSSAHLVLIPHFLGWSIPESQVFPFDMLVQLGTLAAVIIYFWSDLWKIIKSFIQGLVSRKPSKDPNSRMGWYLILASIPASISGLLLKDKVAAVFNDPHATAYFLFGTAALLILAETIGKRSRSLGEIKWFDALWIGIFQAIAIFPGISRSGSTIAGGMTRNMDRPSAARFSFLMSIPIMIGAGLVSISDVLKMPDLGKFLPVLVVGFITALLVGYLSIHWLLNFLTKRSFFMFAGYCVLLAVAVLVTGTPQKNAQGISTVTPLAQSTQTPSPVGTYIDQNPLTVAYTSSLEWLLPAMSTCAGVIHDFSIITDNLPADQLNSNTHSILLRWGQPGSLENYSALLGRERLSLVVNSQNPLSTLPLDLTQRLASGEFRTWGEIFKICPQCFSNAPEESFLAQTPALFFYASGEEPQQIFLKEVMQNRPVGSASALLVPGSLQMHDALDGELTAFGFLPAHYLDAKIKEISISGMDQTTMESPILAISSGEPTGKARDWLICIQKVLNP
ncbi:MAG: undecaprenyl-diphosphatase UppP [Chloroflexi bacterium]|nr:undecaprenyl-diphosphatase UppP [Chloroflexota bacterium]